MSFESLGLSAPVLQAVAEKGYTTPTLIQEKAIPICLMGRDVLGCAQTGTGKTASFVLPMIDILSEGRAKARMPRSLILEPTRELAAQVAENFEIYGKYHKLNMALLIGGVSFEDQERALERGVDVLIATPGRLLDHFERGRLLLTGVELLVIDEADRMLDMGFIPDIERICKLVPFTRQTLFFTATMPPEIRRITEQFLSSPVKVEVSRPATAAATITQQLIKSGRNPARQHEQQVRQAVQVADRAAIDGLDVRELDHPTLGAAAHGARLVQERGHGAATREDERLERLQVFLAAIDALLERCDLRIADHQHAGVLGAGRGRELAAEIEELVLQSHEDAFELARRVARGTRRAGREHLLVEGPREPEDRVQLVDRPERLDARRVLRDLRAADEMRRALVAGAGVDAVDADRHQEALRPQRSRTVSMRRSGSTGFLKMTPSSPATFDRLMM